MIKSKFQFHKKTKMRRDAIILVIFFLIGVCNGGDLVFTAHSGVISIEAEHSAVIRGWQKVAGTSGEAMQDTSARSQGFMTYPIQVDEPGQYFMFLLARTPNGTRSNDCFITIDGDKLYGADNSSRPDGMRVHTADFSWTFLPKGPGYHTPDTIRDKPVYALLEKPGLYELRITSRSRFFVIDKIVLKLDETDPPTGLGPEESIVKQSKN